MFTIQELPFFVILILTILPVTIGIIIFMRVISLFREIILKYRKNESFDLSSFGKLLLFLTIFNVIINIILYLLDMQPDGFSIFDYLVGDMLPITWYVILLYGILIQLSIFFTEAEA